jgi:uncharacterized membrane protein YbhN (UPF0104 family)
MPAWLRSRSFRWLLTALALGFVLWTAAQLARRWEGAAFSAAPLPAALAFLFAVAASASVALGWVLLVQRFALTPVPFATSMAVYAAAAIAKYIPGKLGQPVMRLSGLAPYGFNARTVAAAMLIEVASWCAMGALVAAALLLASGDRTLELGAYAVPVAVACVAAVVLLGSLRAEQYPAFLRRTLGLEQSAPLLPWSVPGVHVLSWALWAAHGALLARSVGALEGAGTARAAAFFVLAPIAGFMALPVPAGMGVRESVTVLGLTPLVGPESALGAAVLSRVASLTADVALWLLFARRQAPGRAAEAPSGAAPGG